MQKRFDAAYFALLYTIPSASILSVFPLPNKSHPLTIDIFMYLCEIFQTQTFVFPVSFILILAIFFVIEAALTSIKTHIGTCYRAVK